jgi:hypothetical protein
MSFSTRDIFTTSLFVREDEEPTAGDGPDQRVWRDAVFDVLGRVVCRGVGVDAAFSVRSSFVVKVSIHHRSPLYSLQIQSQPDWLVPAARVLPAHEAVDVLASSVAWTDDELGDTRRVG